MTEIIINANNDDYYKISKVAHKTAMNKYITKMRLDEDFLTKQRKQQMDYYHKNCEVIKQRRRERYAQMKKEEAYSMAVFQETSAK
jgi:hypothetical protein